MKPDRTGNSEDRRPVFATKAEAFEALARALRDQPKGVPFTDMPAKVSKAELAEFIADQLCETEPAPIQQISTLVSSIRQTPAFNLLRTTNETEAAGGMLTRDGTRRKSPGGIWLHLAVRRAALVQKERRQLEAADRTSKGVDQRTGQRKAEVRKELRAGTAGTRVPQQAPPQARISANRGKAPEVLIRRRAEGGSREC